MIVQQCRLNSEHLYLPRKKHVITQWQLSDAKHRVTVACAFGKPLLRAGLCVFTETNRSIAPFRLLEEMGRESQPYLLNGIYLSVQKGQWDEGISKLLFHAPTVWAPCKGVQLREQSREGLKSKLFPQACLCLPKRNKPLKMQPSTRGLLQFVESPLCGSGCPVGCCKSLKWGA